MSLAFFSIAFPHHPFSSLLGFSFFTRNILYDIIDAYSTLLSLYSRFPTHRTNMFLGKRVVVTGAGKGIGKGLVQMLNKQGASVFAISRTAQDLVDLKTGKRRETT